MRRIILADDVSGAAECAGVAHRLTGRPVQVALGLEAARRATGSTVSVDLDTRSGTEAEARDAFGKSADWVAAQPGPWVYKKTDSLLRGFIRAEMSVLVARTEARCALLVANNPSLGRTITGGRYRVRNVPLHETEFARDPEFPADTDVVAELLKTRSSGLPVHSVAAETVDAALNVGDAGSFADLARWAARPREGILFGGGAEFLAACLLTEAPLEAPEQANSRHAGEPVDLVVSGTASEETRRTIRTAGDAGTPVLSMPAAMRSEQSDDNLHDRAHADWTKQVSRQLDVSPRVVMDIGDLPPGKPASPEHLRQALATAVVSVLRSRRVNHILSEGGATSIAWLRQVGWTLLDVVREERLGVVVLRPVDQPETLVTLKPGSYPYPPGFWNTATPGPST